MANVPDAIFAGATMPPLRLAFMGAPDFCRPGAECARRSRPPGRRRLHPTAARRPVAARNRGRHPVHSAALERGILVRAPASLKARRSTQLRRSRSRCGRRGRLRPVATEADTEGAAARLPQHPCLLARRALARRGPDPARPDGRRRRRPASPSCRWRKASIPGPCCCRNACPSGRRTTPACYTTSWRPRRGPCRPRLSTALQPGR